MTALQKFIVDNGKFNYDAMVNFIDQLEPEKADRMLMALYGIVDYNFPADLPLEVISNGVKYTFECFNYWEDRVIYSYERKVSRWFKTKEDAEKFEGSDYYCQTEDYPYEGTKMVTSKNDMTLNQWKRYADKEKK